MMLVQNPRESKIVGDPSQLQVNYFGIAFQSRFTYQSKFYHQDGYFGIAF